MSWSKAQEKEFATVLFAMGEVFNDSVSPQRAELFCRALEDLPFEQIRAAAQKHVKTQTFFPRPAELRDAALGSNDDRAEIAWIHVLNEVRRVGWTGKPTWPDAATERAAMDLYGGWRALCQRLPADGPELLGYAKQFKSTFRSYAARDSRELPVDSTTGVFLTE